MEIILGGLGVGLGWWVREGGWVSCRLLYCCPLRRSLMVSMIGSKKVPLHLYGRGPLCF